MAASAPGPATGPSPTGAGHPRRKDTPAIITELPTARSKDRRHREVRYVITMSIRVVAFAAAIFIPNPWRWVLIAAAAILPGIAVLLANAVDLRTNKGTTESAQAAAPAAVRPELEAPAETVVIRGQVVVDPKPDRALDAAPESASGDRPA
ncbi:DUF3099 domain-containing protein [Granulicoccus phenolivorans]|uniref:DUF3099 domain-containing protein n=1 Tax=Granulicoccus phenolivorans TaxID=266854 RepID=UPI00041FFEE7|nr:DUF3099 domain-containing protein [Granulicoccus phenolivorans]